MGVVSAWDEFLERTLVRYVAGAVTDSGYAPTPKYGFANDLKHAYELLSGNTDYDRQKNHLRVQETKWVLQMADFFFRTHPCSCLSAKAGILQHGYHIRNRVAHSSEKCRKEFKDTALEFLHPASGSLAQGYSPGELLLGPVQRHFGPQAVQRKLTHFEAFVELYEDLAQKVVS